MSPGESNAIVSPRDAERQKDDRIKNPVHPVIPSRLLYKFD